MTAFYRCPYCGFISTEPKYCPACLGEKQFYVGMFQVIEDAMWALYKKPPTPKRDEVK